MKKTPQLPQPKIRLRNIFWGTIIGIVLILIWVIISIALEAPPQNTPI